MPDIHERDLRAQLRLCQGEAIWRKWCSEWHAADPHLTARRQDQLTRHIVDNLVGRDRLRCIAQTTAEHDDGSEDGDPRALAGLIHQGKPPADTSVALLGPGDGAN